MEKQKKMIDYTSYNEFKYSQGYIDNEDFKPIVIDNVLSQENIDFLYNNLSPDIELLQDWGGRKSWALPHSDSLKMRLNTVINSVIDDQVILNEHFFIKYNTNFGFQSKLFPHWDYRRSQRITMDIQLNYDEEWGVVVEGETYILKFNQGLIFSGSQQIHWRENKELKPGSEIDMLVCNYEFAKDRPLNKNQPAILKDRSTFLMEVTGIGNKPKTS
jgi:hypothetical protein